MIPRQKKSATEVYATTEGGAAECPAKPDMSKGYVWPVYPTFDIVEANVDGSNAKRITTTSGYDPPCFGIFTPSQWPYRSR